jgi:hypothetical protein
MSPKLQKELKISVLNGVINGIKNEVSEAERVTLPAALRNLRTLSSFVAVGRKFYFLWEGIVKMTVNSSIKFTEANSGFKWSHGKLISVSRTISLLVIRELTRYRIELMGNVDKRCMITRMFMKITDSYEPMPKLTSFDGIIDITAKTSR